MGSGIRETGAFPPFARTPSPGLLWREEAAGKRSFGFVSRDWRCLLQKPGFLLHATHGYLFVLPSSPPRSCRAGRMPGTSPQDAELGD